MVEAWRHKAVPADNSFDKIWLTKFERVAKFLQEGDASNGRLHKVFAALRKIINALVEKKDRKADLLTKIEKLCEQARVRVVGLRADEASELRKRLLAW